MAYFVILHSSANLVEAFDTQEEGRAALATIVRQAPDSADEYALLKYDDDGYPDGAAVLGADVAVHA